MSELQAPPIGVLHVEDDPVDAQLIGELLSEGGMSVEIERVDDLAAFKAALVRGGHSLVLADDTIPGMDTLEALAVARELRPDLPFIFVSGTLGEDFAVETLKRGATDYVLKQRLERLVPSVRRALAELADRKLREEAEAAARRKADELRVALDRLSIAQQAGRMGVFDWDLTCDEAYWTPELKEILGIERPPTSPCEAWASMVHPDDLARVEALLAAWMSSSREEERWDCRLRRSGEERWIEARARLVRDEAGRPVRMVGAILDITERVRAQEELEESDRRKDQFLAMLSHELRNPLGPILNSLLILERAEPGGEQARRAQSVIDRQVAHLTRLVDDLLDVTRISRGKIQLRRERIDICELVRLACEDHRGGFAGGQLELVLSLPQTPVWVDVDRARIVQVIGNLLVNSVKFTPARGKIFVSVEGHARAGQAVLCVRDTGIGIAAEMLPRVFEPFTQADASLDRSQGGLGLGLAMVKGLVELHGGSVSAQSEGLGKGAELTARLPMVAAGQRVAAPSEAARRGPWRILIIEDNVDAAESLREVLELSEHTVEVALSGTEGLEKAPGFKPDVVLCDIGLPGMDGYEVARRMRADPVLRGTRLVAVTGYAAPDDIARSKEAGFDAHIAKPPDLETLDEALAARDEDDAR